MIRCINHGHSRAIVHRVVVAPAPSVAATIDAARFFARHLHFDFTGPLRYNVARRLRRIARHRREYWRVTGGALRRLSDALPDLADVVAQFLLPYAMDESAWARLRRFLAILGG